jgi:hypothetical protein
MIGAGNFRTRVKAITNALAVVRGIGGGVVSSVSPDHSTCGIDERTENAIRLDGSSRVRFHVPDKEIMMANAALHFQDKENQ